METIVLTRAEFKALPEYSCSLPTGTAIGKQWKKRWPYCSNPRGWDMGEYSRLLPDNKVEITWRRIECPELGIVERKPKQELTAHLL